MAWRWVIFGALVAASLLFNAGIDEIDKDYGKGMCQVAFSLVTTIVGIMIVEII